MANTPFLDLVKPAGTDKALVSVINSNSDKIDTGVSTLSDQIGAYDFGTLSYTNFISALDTFCSNLANNAVRRVRVYINSGASSPFGNTIHIGEVYKINTDRYNVVLHQNGSLYDVIGDKDANGWHWDKIATSDQIDTLSNAAALCTKAEIIGANSSATFTPARTIGLLIGEYGANNIMYTIFRASSTNVSVGEIKTNGNITVTTNNGVITVANGSSNSWRVRMLEIG